MLGARVIRTGSLNTLLKRQVSMESEPNKRKTMLANRVLLASGVVFASSVLLFVAAHHAGLDQPSAFGPRIGIAIVGGIALMVDRIYVARYRR